MTKIIFNLPDLGEGLPDAEIQEWYVKEGDQVLVDQPLVAMETAKAVVDIPSPYEGRIERLYGQPGDTIETGNPLIAFMQDSTAETPEIPNHTASGATVAGKIEVSDAIIAEESEKLILTETIENSLQTLPVIRAIAKKLDLDLSVIQGQNTEQPLTLDSFCQWLKPYLVGTKSFIAPAKTAAYSTKLKSARKAMVHSMTQAHAQVVQATLSDKANLSTWHAENDFTVRLIRAIAVACRAEPIMNAYFDGNSLTIDIKKNVNLGLAVDTPEGLFVPVIKNADQLSPEGLRSIVNRYKEQAKAHQFGKEDLKDATITLSNFGVFAGYFANPIVVPPTVAIIGAGRSRYETCLEGAEVKNHKILPLSVSFDHRAVTGGEASRFLRALMDDLKLAN